MTEPTLPLTVGDVTYRVSSPTAKVGLALQASYVVSRALKDKVEPPAYAVARLAEYDTHVRDMDEDSLGPVWDQMVADDVPLVTLRLAARAAFAWIVTGSEAIALALFNGKGKGAGDDVPKAPTTTDGGSTTRKRASTSGTTSRPAKSKGSRGKSKPRAQSPG